MKTTAEIESYLRVVRGKREVDEFAILYYCQRCGVEGVHDLGSEAKAGSRTITFEQFKEWLGGTNPSKGEVIVLEDGRVGLVRSSGYDRIAFHALVDASGALSCGNVVVPCTQCHPAGDEDRVRLQRALFKQGLDYNRRQDTLTERFTPASGKYVRVTSLGRRIGVGVFREIDSDGNLVMFVFRKTDAPIAYGLQEKIGPAQDYQLELLSRQERNTLDEELLKEGYIWNGYSKHVEPKDLRRPIGSPYFYIDNYLEIIIGTDKYVNLDRLRFRALNYYTCREEAEQMLVFLKAYKPDVRCKVGHSYYYVDNYLSIAKTTERRNPRDLKRFQAGNYFPDLSQIEQYLARYIEFRKSMLLKDATSQVVKRCKS